ncbi:uncharacterized protein LOC106065786 [Biomphalaria glabrata]|uniref:Uncharacterized protein LOC106065786 n=1 Tax=Biomphalaria glabrata TaxID=6526 RepID=A0A9W2Z4Y4_BIOGL|nr:uncharacterized protein LOC106065786 [Biomphalaria glabrata]KAI8745161.1 hypothetical protein BgiMline_020561 [Biomphalaria glabrata]
MMKTFACIVVLAMCFTCTIQHNRYPECLRSRNPSLNHINFLATLAGRYGKTEFRVGNVTIPTKSTLDIYPVTTDIFKWPKAGTLFAEERLDNVVVRRSLYATVEQDNGNTIYFYPYNFTTGFTDLNTSFDKSQLSCLLPTDLDYTHECDRVVQPSTTLNKAFNFVSWPYCSKDRKNPPVYSAVLTCDTIKVSFTEVSQLSSTPEDQRQYFVLTKTQKVPLPKSYTGNQRYFRCPCN